MDFKLLVFICSTLSVIGIDVSYAETLLIDVLNTTCDQTLDMVTYERIKLSYVEETITNVDVWSSPPRCTFTIVNNDTNMETCITGWGSTAPHWGKGGCDSTFRFYIGYMPDTGYLSGGYHCNSFRSEPMCTSRSKMYAVFQNNFMFYKDIVKIDIYRESLHVPTARATTTRRTYSYTRNWSPSNNDRETRSRTGLLPIIVIVLVVVVVGMTFVGCAIYNHTIKRDTNEETPEQISQRPPITPPVHQVPGQAAPFDADAPSYSSLMQQQQQHLLQDETTNNIAIHDPVYPTAPPIDSLPEHEHTDHDQPGTNPTHGQPVNQTIPTTPPPNYDDIEPPPYPGKWSSS